MSVLDIRRLDQTEREIILAYSAADMSANKAGKMIHMSSNAVEYRLDRIKCKTGVDPRTFFGLARLYYAVESAERIRGKANRG